MSADKISGKIQGDFIIRHGFVTSLVVITILAIATRFTAAFSHDVSWLLYATNEWINGARLYVDIIEINPPLIFFISVLPVSFAKVIGVSYIPVFTIFTYALILATLVYCYRFLMAYSDLDKTLKQSLIAVLYFCLVLLIGNDFGQREHLLVIFSLPYIFLAGLRLEGKEVSFLHAVTVGLVAFFGFALKPYFLAVPIALEILLLVKSKNILKIFRQETIILAILMPIYLAVIFIYTPEYISHIYKIAQEVYAAGYKASLFKIVLGNIALLAMTGAILFLPEKGEIKKSPLFLVFLASSLGFWVSFFIQQKGWYYHIYPVLVMQFVLAVFWFYSANIIQKLNLYRKSTLDEHAKNAFYIFVFCVASLGIVGFKQVVLSPLKHHYLSDQVAAYKPVYKKETGQELKSVYVLGFYLTQGFPMVTDNKVVWASRFPSLWVLRGLIWKREKEGLSKSEQSKTSKWIEHYNMKAVTADIAKFKPNLIIVEADAWRKNKTGVYKFSLLGYFKTNAAFQKIWSSYRLQKSTEMYDFYTRTNN